MNTQNVNTQEVSPKVESVVKVALMQFGQGKYSQIATEYANKTQHLFGFNDEQADRFGHQLMADMGRLNMSTDALKIGKTDKHGMVKIDTKETSGGKVHETNSMTLVAGINELEKAMSRIPSLGLGKAFTLPTYLQFNPKSSQ